MQSADEEPRDPFVQSLFIAADASLADTGFTDKTMQAVTRVARQSRRRRVIGWGCASALCIAFSFHPRHSVI